MKLMITWEIHPDQRQELFEAFAAMDLADYQSQQGPHVEVLGRWHDVINGRGWGVCEANDEAAVSAWLMKWHAAVDFEISVVHDDAAAHALARAHVADGS